MKITLRKLWGSLLLWACMGIAHAGPAFTITNTTGDSLGNPPFTLGWQFSVSGPVSVTHLGLFDDAQDGFNERHELGLWDNAGTLLASASVGAGASGVLLNQFRYFDIADVVLGAGIYQIGALFLSGSDNLLFPGFATGFAMASEITFLTNAYEAGGVLTHPTSSAGADPAYFGPNFLFEATAVPEPGSLALLGIGLVGLALRRRATAASTLPGKHHR